MAQPRIVLFTDAKPETGRALADCLRGNRLAFSEKNIEADTKSADLVGRVCGDNVVPTVYADGAWLADPTEDEVLRAAGAIAAGSTAAVGGRANFDVIVIGLGPAGLAACHGCRMGGLSVLGLDENEPGGHLLSLRNVDEYLGVGHDDTFSGEDVADNFAQHARQSGAVLMRGRVQQVRTRGLLKRVNTEKSRFWSRAVVVATGAARNSLDVRGLEKYLNQGIRVGGRLDPRHYAGRRVCVVGDGEEALNAAIFLAQHAGHVTLLCPGETPSAEPQLVQRAVAQGVRMIPSARLVEVRGRDALDYLFFEEKGIEEEQGLPVDAIVIALNPAPKAALSGLESLPQENGYFAHGEGGKTMFGGIYVAGDCTSISLRTLQGVVASGSLCSRRLWQWLAQNPLPRFR